MTAWSSRADGQNTARELRRFGATRHSSIGKDSTATAGAGRSRRPSPLDLPRDRIIPLRDGIARQIVDRPTIDRVRDRGMAVAVGALAVALLLPAGAFAANGHANFHAVCPAPPARAAHCHALVVTDAHGNPAAAPAPTGLSPAQIQSVYNFPTSNTAGSGKTIAIVDAYDDPTAESDLGVFSSQFGLPACTSANGCFSKVDQNGGTNYPVTNGGWALEISLDVQWAHAIAPGAKILLVEAATNNFSDLLAAEDYARFHAQYVSNSWGASEFDGEQLYDSHFASTGSALSVFVSAGDFGLPAEYPSSSPNVISVGGTTLHFDVNGNFTSETGWSSGGGGCSTYEVPNSAQYNFPGYAQVNCNGKRATPDVSLDADPASGVSVYDTTPYNGSTGWFQVGGTSASSPMWAARSADAGVVVDARYVYGNSIAYRDIAVGNNGASCLVGYDLCSGRGSWLDQPTATTPSISSFAPMSGPIGATVVIKGSGLAGTTGVSFNGTAATSFTSTSTQVVATVPAGTTSGPITVTTPGGTASTATSFTITSNVGDLAVTYQIGVDHAGVQNDPALAPPFTQRWTVSLPNPASYPLIAAGKVFVTTTNGSTYGTWIYALDQATGQTVWSQFISGTYSFSGAAYDNGQVFVVNYNGVLQAFGAATGALAWSAQLPGQYAFTSPPTAGNGVVYVGGAGSGGTVYAVDEVTGGLISTASVENGDDSSPALANGNVYVAYACDQAYGFGQATLSLLWHFTTGCEGGGGKTVVYANGRVYTRDFINGNLVLDAGTGGQLATWTPASTNALAPAIDGSTIYWTSIASRALTAESSADGSTRWTFGGDGQLDSAPIVLATPNGEFVVVGSATGALYVLNAATGAVAWQTTVAPIAQPDEQNVTVLAGLGAGQGLLVVPAGNSITAFAPAPAPAPTISSFTPVSGPVGTAVTINGSHFTGATDVRFNGTAATSFSVVNDGRITTTVPAGTKTGAISVTTPAGAGSSSGVFTVTVPDFGIGASPSSQSVVAGSSTTYTVTITPSGGFTSAVALSVGGVPAGASATFSPASTGSTSTLTVSTARSAKTGAGTLTITGTGGGKTHSTTVTLQVTKK
jgi:outer membrane protein assembly factor BamB